MSLPDNFLQLGAKYKNLAFVNIMCSSPIRIYYKDRKFHCFITSAEGIIPIMSASSIQLANIIADVLKNELIADLTMYYPTSWSSKKKNKLSSYSGEYENNYVNIILKHILLLI